jgi:glycerol-3-phosphate O-acyltransferase
MPAYRLADFEALLATPDVREGLEAAAARQGIAAAEVPEIARGHARAIAAEFSYGIALKFDRLLTWSWRRLLDGIEIRGIETVKHLEEGRTLVYLPCHRSHLDYLLLSHVIFHHALTPPFIAAGDNLNLPLIGRLLRAGGGFFMRRSFKGDPLYAAVFAAYLQGLLASELPIEFFLEGGRSRTGRMLPPKTGLLGMLMQAYARRPAKPLVIVPVYLGYERLPEGSSFVAELSGQPKRRESLLGVFSTIRLLNQKFGRAYVSFGEPLDVSGWLDAHCAGWRDAAEVSRPAVTTLAEEVLLRINAVAPVNPVNWVALALLESPGSASPRPELAQRIAAWQARLPGTALAPADCIAQALRLGMVEAQGDVIAAPGEKAALLEYFRNNVLHHFEPPKVGGEETAWKSPG